MLVDSRSTHTFVSHKVAALFDSVTPLPAPVLVRVADGGELVCSDYIPNYKWWAQGFHCRTNMRVLPLGTYDVILDMDWLEHHSPMEVHWRSKTLAFDHNSSRITLKGIATSLTVLPVSGSQLKGL